MGKALSWVPANCPGCRCSATECAPEWQGALKVSSWPLAITRLPWLQLLGCGLGAPYVLALHHWWSFAGQGSTGVCAAKMTTGMPPTGAAGITRPKLLVASRGVWP